MTIEEWRPVVGWEGLYEVSDQGRMRSLPRLARDGRRAWRGKLLKAVPNGAKGYPHVIMTDGPRRQGRHVHAMVMEAFVGPCPTGLEVCHINSVNTDARLVNLRYGTRTSNHLDRVAAGHDHNAKRDACRRNHPYTDESTDWREGRTKEGEVRMHRYCKLCRALRRQKERAAA